MARKTLEFPQGVVECIEATRTGGTILCAAGSEGVNGMTIGWISVGSIWGRPVCTVLVRPSRHTFKMTESGDSFTVSVLGEEFKGAVDLFGTESGRDLDKFQETGLTAAPGLAVGSPYIVEADIVIECRTAFKQQMEPACISADFVHAAYPQGDYHKIYYGEILAIHAK